MPNKGDIIARIRQFLARVRVGIPEYGLWALLMNRRLAGLAVERQRQYQRWRSTHTNTPDLDPWGDMFFSVPTIFFSFILDCDDTHLSHIAGTIHSLQAQSFPFWRVYLASRSPLKRELLRRRYRSFKRLWVGSPKKMKLSGTHIVYLTAGDILDEQALYHMSSQLRRSPELDAIYCDEDTVDGRGNHSRPIFKPGWSPEYLLSKNYVGRLCAVRRKVADEAGGVSLQSRGGSSYDLLLRLSVQPRLVAHVPRVLCHVEAARWRRRTDGRRERQEGRVLTKHVAGRPQKGRVSPGLVPHTHRVRFPVRGHPIVSVIIPFRDKPELLSRCLTNLRRHTTYPYYELLLISTNSEQPETKKLMQEVKKLPRVRLFERNVPFNYSAVNNWAARRAVGDYLLFLNNDTEVLTPDWMEALLEYAQLPSVGAVGAKLLYPNRTIQHAGVVVGLTGMANHPSVGLTESLCYQQHASVVRNYLAVTGACLMVQQEKYWEVGGFDEDFVLCGSDVALGIALYQHGYRNVYLPHVQLFHYEKTTRGEGGVPRGDFFASFRYYEPYLREGDPYYNRHLSLHKTDASLRLEERDFYPEIAAQFSAASDRH